MNQISGDKWEETCELFHEISDLTAAERAARLNEIAASDPELKEAVESLLAADDMADERLARLKSGITDVVNRNLHDASRTIPDLLRLAGETISHFRIIEPIAVGGMGIVYRAHDLTLNREVALKLPLAAQQLDPASRARFLREAHAVGALDHRNVCNVYEAGESADGHPFIAMALYAGEPLKSRIARDGALPLPDALDIARQIASGLAFAHAAGVIHRDLKPGNIMLLPDGTVKILDFGLAKFADVTDVSAAGMGTVGYMSPEQILGGEIDARTDLWSLGALMYEMLTGVRPFPGKDGVAISHAILQADVRAPSTLRPGLSRSVDELVLNLLRKEPAQRYSSADVVSADLELIEQGEKPTYRPRVRRRLRVGKKLAGLVVLAVIGIFAATGWIFAAANRKPTENADAFQFYQRGREYEKAGTAGAAETLYGRALALDPDFALARARLALVHLRWSPRPVDARIEQGKSEAIKALRLDPRLADAHYALGLYWQQKNIHDRALAEFALARRGMGKSVELHGAMGSSYRSLGRWDEAVAEFERVRQIDPGNLSFAPDLALTYARLRRYRESQAIWDRFIALTPDGYLYTLVKGYSVTRSHGTADTLAAALRRLPPDWDDGGMATLARFTVARLQRRPLDALAAMNASQRAATEDNMAFFPVSLLKGIAYEDLGDRVRARTMFEDARSMMSDSTEAHPRDPRLQISLGKALAGLGRREEAIVAARRAMAIAPISTDVVLGTAIMGGAAEIFAYLGENAEAIRLLEQLLSMPAGREASVPLIRADPAYDRLRSDPQFERMLRQFPPR